MADISIKGRSGPIAALEDEFRDFLDGLPRHVVSFNSGTSGLLAAYKAMGVGPGVGVVGPALTYHAALSPALALGGEVVLADVERGSRCLDPASAEAAIGPETRVLTVVHQWGHAADMEAFVKLAERYDLFLLEDCSHAHGSRYRGRPCGTFGHAAVFSLQAAKAVYAGEGGILVTDDDALHDRAVLAGHYRDRARDCVIDEELRAYWATGFGMKLRMSPLNAVVALHSLRLFPERSAQRRRCLEYLNEQLRKVRCVRPVAVAEDVDMGAWYGFKPLFDPGRSGLTPEEAVAAMQAEGMEVSIPSGGPLADAPLFAGETNAAFGDRAREVHRTVPLDNVRYLESHALSFPTFNRWPEDREVIDDYVTALCKIDAAYGV